MKLTFIYAFSVSICLLFSISTSAQQENIYRDTSSRSTYLRISNYPSTSFSERQSKHGTVFPNSIWNPTVYFPKDFQNGFDSIYRRSGRQVDFYLSEVWTYKDKKGTAKWENYHPNGQIAFITNYIGQELDTIIIIDSTFNLPEETIDNIDTLDEEDWKVDTPVYIILEKEYWKRDTFYSYKALRIDTVKGWYEDGSRSFTQAFENGFRHGATIVYHRNGRLAQVLTFENDLIVGVHEEWFENGQLKTEINYVDGDKNGDEKHWNEDGILIKDLQYKEDELFSWQKYYDDNGKLIRKEYYLNGKLEKVKEMD